MRAATEGAWMAGVGVGVERSYLRSSAIRISWSWVKLSGVVGIDP